MYNFNYIKLVLLLIVCYIIYTQYNISSIRAFSTEDFTNPEVKTFKGRFIVPITDLANAELLYTYRSNNQYKGIPINMRACPSEPYGKKKGDNDDYTDVSVRAMLVKQNGIEKVMITTGHLFPNRMIGDDFNSLSKVCKPVWKSMFDPVFENFKYNEWFSSAYTKDGEDIMAIAQHDWHAGKALESDYKNCSNAVCQLCKSDPFNCWWLGLTIMKSTDGGESYKQVVHYKLATPEIEHITKLPKNQRLLNYYTVDENNAQAVGYYQTTNIIKGVSGDDNYYFITRFRDQPDSPKGKSKSANFVLCRALNSSNLFVGGSWKGYTTDGFIGNLQKSEGIAPQPMKKFREIRHISYNIFLNKYLIFGFAMQNNIKFLAYMLSKGNNILDWDVNTLTYIIPATYTVNNIEYEIRYPTIIDHDYNKLVNIAIQSGIIPASQKLERRNFDLTSLTPYIYATIRKGEGNNQLDLVRFSLSIK